MGFAIIVIVIIFLHILIEVYTSLGLFECCLMLFSMLFAAYMSHDGDVTVGEVLCGIFFGVLLVELNLYLEKHKNEAEKPHLPFLSYRRNIAPPPPAIPYIVSPSSSSRGVDLLFQSPFRVDKVQFSVIAPAKFVVGSPSIVRFFIYEENFREEVNQIILSEKSQ